MAESPAAAESFPIWEFGLAATTAGPRILDPYRVADIHGLFSDEFPHAEQQSPVEALALFPTPESPMSLGPQLRLIPVAGAPPTRWWFVSPHQERLIQLQDNFFALNWRRLVLPPAAPPPYPGYEAMVERFFTLLAKLDKSRERGGETLPEPVVIDLLYDNIILLDSPDGPARTIDEVLAHFSKPPGRSVSGYNSSWTETIDGWDDPSAGLRVNILAGGASQSPEHEARTVIKLTMNARATPGGWEGARKFFDVAHAHIHRTFAALITEEIRSTWGAK